MVVNKSKDAFRTIAEVADELDVATHVLRFWETKFPQIQPMKRNGGHSGSLPCPQALFFAFSLGFDPFLPAVSLARTGRV